MKITMRKIVACLMALITVLQLFPIASANAEIPSIKVYTQSNYSGSKWKLAAKDGETRTLASAGCGLFAYAHAIQILSQTKRGDDLLTELIGVCSDPNGKRGHKKCTHSNKDDLSFLAYRNYLKNTSKYGFTNSSYKVSNKSEADIRACFDAGNVIVFMIHWSGGGHVILASDYAVVNGTTYIQIIDSHSQSTTKSGRPFYNATYSYDRATNTMRANGTTKLSDGKIYWVKCSKFKQKADGPYRIGGGTWSGHNKNENMPVSLQLDKTSTVIYLNETLTLGSTAYPENANQSVTWTSSDTSIATVDTSGNVHPLKTGTVTIRAASTSDPNIYAECSVRIDYQGTGSINYNNIKFPYHLKVNSSGVSGGYTFAANSGTISTAEGSTISSVVFKIYRSNGATLEYVKSNVDAQAITMESVSSNLNALFKQISGKNTSCYFEITVTDNHGRVLSAGRNFDTRTDGVNTSTANSQGVQPFTWNYTDPILIDTTYVNGKRYELWKSSRTWTEAALFANDMGGYLASISSAEENTLAHNMLKNFQASAANTGGTWVGAWIGGSKQNNEWSWTDGSAFSYTNWNSGNPSNDWGTEHYTGLRYTDGKWNSVNDNNAYYCTFIIEYDEVKVTDILLEGEPIVTVDDQFTLIPTVLPENASNKTIYFATSDSDVATVDVITGEVTALSEGEVTIAAIAQDGSDVVGTFSLYVQHKPIHPTGITLKADNNLYTGMNTITVYAGEEFYLDTIFTPADTDDQSVYYYSDDEGIAIVEDYTSKVIALSPGTCELVAVSNDGGIESRLTLIVLNASVILPENLTEIEDEAFIGTAISYVRLPEGITRIGSRAFADCPNLHRIYIPESCTSIAADVFTPGIDLTIYGQDGSYAEFYAGRHGFDFVAMGN